MGTLTDRVGFPRRLDELTLAAQSGPRRNGALAYAGWERIAEDRLLLTATRQFIAALQAAPTDPIASWRRCGCSTWRRSRKSTTMIAGAARALKAPARPRAARLCGKREHASPAAARRRVRPAIESDAWRAVARSEVRVGGPFGAVASLRPAPRFPLDGAVPATAALNESRDGVSRRDVALTSSPATASVLRRERRHAGARGEYSFWVEARRRRARWTAR